MAGLRETKKARTRQRISDEATRLFQARGFDAVTVAEVAEAAEVSKMTIFNHFPRKEDMLFDRLPQATALVAETVRGRPPGTSPVAALRDLVTGLVGGSHPLSVVRDDAGEFLRTVHDSPALVARAHELAGELEHTLAGALAEAGVERPALLAAMTTAACRVAFVATARRLLAGARSDELVDDYVETVHAAFDVLERWPAAE